MRVSAAGISAHVARITRVIGKIDCRAVIGGTFTPMLGRAGRPSGAVRVSVAAAIAATTGISARRKRKPDHRYKGDNPEPFNQVHHKKSPLIISKTLRAYSLNAHKKRSFLLGKNTGFFSLIFLRNTCFI
jgi:hypothetical protein